MDKFYTWLENNYSTWYFYKNPSNKMLIGYMIEYVHKKYKDAHGWLAVFIGKKLEEIIFSENLYTELKYLIKEIDEN
jgi:hypothetical protein